MDLHSIYIGAVHRPFVPVGKVFGGVSICRGLHSRTANAASINNNPHTSTETNVAVSPRDTIAQLVFKVRDLRNGPTIASPTAMAWLLVLQALALVGAAVGGILARNRRRSLLEANEKLRRINEGLRARSSSNSPAAGYFSSMDGEEDLKEDREESALIKQSLEKSLGGPSAAHPNESYGFEDFGSPLSLAQARRVIDTCIRDTKLKLHPILKSCNHPQRERCQGDVKEMEGVVESLNQALRLATDIKDPWAERILIRLRGKAQRLAGNLRLALVDLQDVLRRLRHDEDAANTKQLESTEHALAVEAIRTDRADVLGELGDVLTELGEYEEAGKAYDDCLAAMNEIEEQVILP
jgi:tetratricopeptide (TPR) repeat protein